MPISLTALKFDVIIRNADSSQFQFGSSIFAYIILSVVQSSGDHREQLSVNNKSMHNNPDYGVFAEGLLAPFAQCSRVIQY